MNGYFKLIWPRVARAFCTNCGREIRPDTLFFFLMLRQPPISTLFPYTSLFRSQQCDGPQGQLLGPELAHAAGLEVHHIVEIGEHTSELQSRRDLVCRLLLEK